MGDEQYAYTIEGKMALPYQYFAGATGSKFIVALRDEKKILAVKAEQSGLTYVPPRQVDDRTFENLEDNWVEVKDTGEVTNFTIIRYEEPYQPMKPPFVIALIKLDGSDTPIAHLIKCDNVEDVSIGMRVKAVFADEPVNNILEIQHFIAE